MKCARPDCQGEIVDGYCDECGLAPAQGAPPQGAPVQGAPPQGALEDDGSLTVVASSVSTPTLTQSGLSRPRLGAGLVPIPPVEAGNPADAVMINPAVPENRRFCAVDGAPVGRSRGDRPGLTEGWCPQCGTPFSFEPKLSAGDLVAGQYEVAGCLAHGGMGWIYLARDRNVSNRWVVLKGLLNTGDHDATAAALAERRFLAEVDHPNIVKIFNFVEHGDQGYIVMEYVGGRSLKQILLARREAAGGTPNPLPPAEAIAYIHEILPALGYLHDQRLLFCDFKLDNVIQTRHSLTLIDLGGVYRMDEPKQAVFGTVGYQAPEIATAGPSVASDLFTVARTLAVLCIDFRGYQGKYKYTLPAQESVPLFERYDSLYQWLRKGTAPDPRDRFATAEEMREQLLGVLREVVADTEDRPVPAASTLFTSPLRAGTDRPDWRVLPRPQAAAEDPNAGYLAALTASSPQAVIAQLRSAPTQTVEVDLRMAGALIDNGDLDGAEALLDELTTQRPRDWRVRWYRGLAALASERLAVARELFRSALEDLPGDAAPKLGLGIACEESGDLAEALRWYRIVAQTDPSVTSASFGLARCRLRCDDRPGALEAYARVPDTSSGYLDAQVARLRCMLAGRPGLDELLAAGATLKTLPIDDDQRERLTVELFGAALRFVDRNPGAPGPDVRLGDRPLQERDIRLGLESSLRSLARRAPSRSERIRLVDQANHMRPRTWT